MKNFIKWLKAVYQNDKQNTIFEVYNNFRNSDFEDNKENFENVILKDIEFLKVAENESEYKTEA